MNQAPQPQMNTPFNPHAWVTSLLSQISYKERDVLQRRFGLEKSVFKKSPKHARKMRETLEEIGRTHNITRERVRQIEATAVANLKSLLEKDVQSMEVTKAEMAIKALIKEYGDAMSQDHLLEAYFTHNPSLAHSEEEMLLQKQSLLFVVSQLLANRFVHVKEDKSVVDCWQNHEAADKTLRKLIKELEQLMDKKNKPVALTEVMSDIKGSNDAAVTEKRLLASLRAAKTIKQNKFSEWGLTNWRTIVPKKTNDKIYLVLKKEGRPMHFTEIATKINEIGFDKKSAYPATVHNELILDENYVLVGRGIYALREWGYTPGVVSDVIMQVMKEAKHPMDKDEIVEKVLSQRMVKKSTIYLALMNKKRFKKVDGHKYSLAEVV